MENGKEPTSKVSPRTQMPDLLAGQLRQNVDACHRGLSGLTSPQASQDRLPDVSAYRARRQVRRSATAGPILGFGRCQLSPSSSRFATARIGLPAAHACTESTAIRVCSSMTPSETPAMWGVIVTFGKSNSSESGGSGSSR